MSTVEDFRNAPVGATATHDYGGRAMKMDAGERRWVTPTGIYLDDEEMEQRGFTLDPLEPCPASAREALDLAWALAHEVKEGQVIPKGTRYLEVHNSRLREGTAVFDIETCPECLPIRTLEPLPEPEPDWLDALVVLATCGCRGMELWQPHNEKDGTWECAHCGLDCHWSELVDATPLYPKGQNA